MKLTDYTQNLIAHGRCSFTLDEAEKNLGKSRKSITLSIEHLEARKEIANPAKGFYVIVTPEYQIYECLPAEYFVPYLMEYWQIDYYAGLLTAAMYHEAAHQAPQLFQVFVEKNRRPIHCGKIKIEFIARKNIVKIPSQEIFTQKSKLRISTPEATAMDLICYPNHAGGLNHIVTVLVELHEKMRAQELSKLLENQPEIAWKQRLGYLLDAIGAKELAKIVENYLSQQKRVDYVLLMPGLERTNQISSHNLKWKIIENTNVESDL